MLNALEPLLQTLLVTVVAGLASDYLRAHLIGRRRRRRRVAEEESPRTHRTPLQGVVLGSGVLVMKQPVNWWEFAALVLAGFVFIVLFVAEGDAWRVTRGVLGLAGALAVYLLAFGAIVYGIHFLLRLFRRK